MISSVSDYHFVTGANVDAEHPHGDLDRILIDGGIMPLRTGVSPTTGVANANILRGEDVAFILERREDFCDAANGAVAWPSYSVALSYSHPSISFTRNLSWSQAYNAIVAGHAVSAAYSSSTPPSEVSQVSVAHAIQSLPTGSIYLAGINSVVTKLQNTAPQVSSYALNRQLVSDAFVATKRIKYAMIDSFGGGRLAVGSITPEFMSGTSWNNGRRAGVFVGDRTIAALASTYWDLPNFTSYGSVPSSGFSSASLWMTGTVSVEDSQRAVSASSQFSMKVCDGTASGQTISFEAQGTVWKTLTANLTALVDNGFTFSIPNEGEMKMVSYADTRFVVIGTLAGRTDWD